MAEKKQTADMDSPRKAPGTKSARRADGANGNGDGRKGVVARAADGVAARLTRGGKAADSAVGSRPARSAASDTKAAPRTKVPDLRKDLRDFAAGRPQGWGHDDWLQFLESLQSRGHNITDREAIGLALERERLDFALSRIKGLGPQRRQALIDRFGTLWALRSADSGEIAKAGKLPADLAQRVKTELPDAH